ncbi:conserved domain protein [Aciduliprofundum boonei T469]|nr:conserved domain protein [Aciduliprofundum boonei T469]
MSEVEITRLKVQGKEFLGLRVEMPNAPLLLIKGTIGFAMCGYLNPSTAEKLGDVAIMVSGVNTFEDMLNAKIKWSSPKAKELGIEEGRILRDEIDKL